MTRTLTLLPLLLAVLGLAACQTETAQPGTPVISPQPLTASPPTLSTPNPAPRPAPAPPTNPSAVFEGLNAATDPCAAQLQDLCGALLMAYAVNKQLPPTLEQLQPFAQGVTLHYTCPISQKHYIYLPDGLKAQNIRDTLLVYDPDPVHNHQRWAIVMSPAQPNNPTSMFVIPLNDKLFNAYQQK